MTILIQRLWGKLKLQWPTLVNFNPMMRQQFAISILKYETFYGSSMFYVNETTLNISKNLRTRQDRQLPMDVY